MSAVASVLFLLIGGFEPFYLRVFTLDRGLIARHHEELPYRKLPGFRRFLQAALESTEAGSPIGLWVAGEGWDRGYEYGYYRSVYLLSGRRVIPLMDKDSRLRTSDLGDVRYLACWRCDPPFDGFQIMWKSRDGVLAKRR